MSTHNIGFYEEISKIIFELSSNIFKYAPYYTPAYEVYRGYIVFAFSVYMFV